MNGKVMSICISPAAGQPMQEVYEVEAIAGAGLKGDRYCAAEGSFNANRPGHRQVTLINSVFFSETGYDLTESRRNIVTLGVELMRLIDKEFQIGEARFRGVGYAYPCDRPTKLAGGQSTDRLPFSHAFHDRGGLVAEVIEGGMITWNDAVIPHY